MTLFILQLDDGTELAVTGIRLAPEAFALAGAPPVPVPESLFLTLAETAERLKLKEDYVYKLVRSGDLKGSRFGRMWRVSVTEVARYAAAKDGQELRQSGIEEGFARTRRRS